MNTLMFKRQMLNKVTFAVLILLGLPSILWSQNEKISYPADSVSADGKKSYHGLRIDPSPAVSLSDFISNIDKAELPQQVTLSGTVEAACQAKGCWMTLPINDKETIRVRFKDYGFFVPLESAGKKATMAGRISADTMSVDMLRHYAIDGGMSEEEAKRTITAPKVEWAFEATGVILEDEE